MTDMTKARIHIQELDWNTLKEEVEPWLSANTFSPWHVEMLGKTYPNGFFPLGPYPTPDIAMVTIRKETLCEIVFEDPNEAVLFALKFGSTK